MVSPLQLPHDACSFRTEMLKAGSLAHGTLVAGELGSGLIIG